MSATEGDHLGYDVRSFEENGKDRFIEVKTTRYGKEAPFYVSRNQVSVSSALGQAFHLYRVFNFRKRARLFSLVGALDHVCTLEPSEYLARVG